jgi:hypothetical protein
MVLVLIRSSGRTYVASLPGIQWVRPSQPRRIPMTS